MRFLSTLKNDIRFQITYGFYFLYAFFSFVYSIALMLTPFEYKHMVASLIILTDPAMLGVFFIGGIWLLEKGEGLHCFWSISPLRSFEYVFAKSISLAFLSTIAGDIIVLIGMGHTADFILLSICVFLGAIVFNFIGLIVASYARSVNHYMMIVVLPTVFLSIPPILGAFGITHPILRLFPGTALLHIIADSIDTTSKIDSLSWIVLILWLVIVSFLATKRIRTALQEEGNKSI